MPKFELEIEVNCLCRNPLCHYVYGKGEKHLILITPCRKCLDKAEVQGFNEGYDKGIRDGGIE